MELDEVVGLGKRWAESVLVMSRRVELVVLQCR